MNFSAAISFAGMDLVPTGRQTTSSDPYRGAGLEVAFSRNPFLCSCLSYHPTRIEFESVHKTELIPFPTQRDHRYSSIRLMDS